MDKKQKLKATIAVFALSLTVVSCNTAETGSLPTEDGISIVSASFGHAAETRVSLEQAANLSLLSKWSPGDKVDVFINKELAYKNVPISLSDDALTGTFGVDVSEAKYPGEVEMICVTTDGSPVLQNGALYSNASLVRTQLSKYHPPVYAVATLSSDRSYIKMVFKHYLAYEVLHIQNASNEEITFALNGYNVNGNPWFKFQGSVSIPDGRFVVDTKATEDPIKESEVITIPPMTSDVIISAFVPMDASMTEASLVAKINGTDITSTNTKSSDVILQVGHAYHVYAVWDGIELWFAVGGSSELDASGNGYGTSGEGDISGSGLGYGSADSGTISGAGSGYENGN